MQIMFEKEEIPATIEIATKEQIHQVKSQIQLQLKTVDQVTAPKTKEAVDFVNQINKQENTETWKIIVFVTTAWSVFLTMVLLIKM